VIENAQAAEVELPPEVIDEIEAMLKS
jgi:hypothetical protein